jgi:hypothetical protein
MITNCSRCGRGYEESSEETANDPGRLCMPCWHAEKVREAEQRVARMTKSRDADAEYMRKQTEGIETLCGLVDRFIRKVVEGMRPGKEFADYSDKIRDAWRDLGWCDYCGNLGCDGSCREDDR